MMEMMFIVDAMKIASSESLEWIHQKREMKKRILYVLKEAGNHLYCVALFDCGCRDVDVSRQLCQWQIREDAKTTDGKNSSKGDSFLYVKIPTYHITGTRWAKKMALRAGPWETDRRSIVDLGDGKRVQSCQPLETETKTNTTIGR